MSVKDVSDAEVCTAVADYTAGKLGGMWPYEALATRTGQPEKVCFRAMERAFRRGLIEYGVSLRSGWLTKEGIKLVTAAVE